MSTDAFAAIRRARSLGERYPDAPRGAAHVLLVLATYANGRTGSSIRPGHLKLMAATGLSREAVRVQLRWLEAHGEIRCDKRGHNGSAAHYTILGVGPTPRGSTSEVGPSSSPSRANSTWPLQPNQPTSGSSKDPSGVGSGEWHATGVNDSAAASPSGDATSHQENDVNADELARFKESNARREPEPEPERPTFRCAAEGCEREADGPNSWCPRCKTAWIEAHPEHPAAVEARRVKAERAAQTEARTLARFGRSFHEDHRGDVEDDTEARRMSRRKR